MGVENLCDTVCRKGHISKRVITMKWSPITDLAQNYANSCQYMVTFVAAIPGCSEIKHAENP